MPTHGIRDILAEDVKAAAQLDCAIKLIARSHRDEDGTISASVAPMLVPMSNQLAGVDDVFNAVLVKGDMLGDVVFYGKGAGKLPTASAVVADVIDALKNGAKIHDSLFWRAAAPEDGLFTDNSHAAYYVRSKGVAAPVLAALCGEGKVVFEQDDMVAYLADDTCDAAVEGIGRKLEALGGHLELVLRRLEG